MNAEPMSDRGVRTTCPYCGVGCGVLVARDAGGARIAGDPDHPANFGRLCSKGMALGETLSLEGRLLNPLVRGERASWDTALALIADTFAASIKSYGPDSVAFYVSGQLLTEDYYLANKLMKGFIGSANIDTNSRLCMASAVAGHKRAFGADVVPVSYEDLELADLVVLVGSNLAWCHPVLFQRLAEAREKRGTKVVVVDPRRTPTAEIADLFLPIAPGADVTLFNGLLHHLWTTGCADEDFLSRHTSGPFDALAAAAAGLNEIGNVTGLKSSDLGAFYEMFAAHERAVTVFSQGVNQSSAGTDKVNAIINCHLLTGRIGKPGMGPFSITGQPNAMGGREVGGLANQLAAHMEIENARHRALVRRFWDAPRIAEHPGLKAVDMFRAVADGSIRAIWIMGTNPAVTMPEADLARDALKRCPFVVVSDVTGETDTAHLAHVLLPAAAWGEKSGTVTNSERRISRQRAFLALPGEAKPDWWIIAETAKRMGFHGFDYSGPAAIFREHAALSGEGNDGSRAFDISALSQVSDEDYKALAPFLWPVPHAVRNGKPRSAGDFACGRFFTADARARLVPTPYRSASSKLSKNRPLTLNTGRVRDQWHTMTRTGKVARLMDQAPEPYLSIHPQDAAHFGLEQGTLAHIESEHGQAVARVHLSQAELPGTVFMPMHWSDTFASAARVDALIAGNVDPVSGQPELKLTPVTVRPFAAARYGFLVSVERPNLETCTYWALARANAGWRAELALSEPRADWPSFVRDVTGLEERGGLLAYTDERAHCYRFAVFRSDRLVFALFISARPVEVSRSWVVSRLSEGVEGEKGRVHLLAGRAARGMADPGAIVCSCFEVGVMAITAAILSGAATSVEEVGAHLKAGTNCGSCRPEIRKLLKDATGHLGQ